MSDDLISRQAAIDAMCELMHHWFGGDPKDEIREIKQELEKLPSAQPEPSQAARDIADIIENEKDMRVIARSEIIRCKECKRYESPSHKIYENCVRWMKSNCTLLPIKPDDYCSYAERRTDGRSNKQTSGDRVVP